MAVTRDEVKRLLGDIDDHLIAEAIESGASIEELEQVSAHLAEETDVMGEARQPLTGRALALYETLRRMEETGEPDR